MYILFGSTTKDFTDIGGGADYLLHSNQESLPDFIEECCYFLCDKFNYPDNNFWAHIFDTNTCTIIHDLDYELIQQEIDLLKNKDKDNETTN